MNKALPSPKDLAKKEATRPISIRVKEKTMLAFEKMAQQYGTTASAMINGLLDYYVSNNASDMKTNKSASQKVMKQYLEKLASRMNKFTDEDLCLALAEDREHANVDDLLPRDYKWCALNDPTEGAISVFLGDALNVEFLCNPAEEARLFSMEEDSLMVDVPMNKYPIVGYIMSSYALKNDNLYDGKRKQIIDQKSLEQIVKIINETDVKNRTELAKKICDVLASYESPLDGEE